jgi:hypothetical protein
VLFNKDVLFIHVPKTGGWSLTRHLLVVLPKPVWYVHSEPIPEGIPTEGVVHVRGNGHESLDEADACVQAQGFAAADFPVILAVLRNPYALEVSRYAYALDGHPWDRGPNQQLAMTHDFETFAIESMHQAGPQRPLESYFLLQGALPKNLRLVRFENLAEEATDALRAVGITGSETVPWVNRSRHGPFLSYYTRDAEQAVYEKYRWVFDHGYYERLGPAELGSPTRPSPYRQRLARIRAVASAVLPRGATLVLVWSPRRELPELPDQRLVRLTEGDEPLRGDAAAVGRRLVARLDELRARGAEFLLAPSFAFPWLDHVPDFQQELLARGRRIWADADCRIFSLSGAGSGSGTAAPLGWQRILAQGRRVRDRVARALG